MTPPTQPVCRAVAGGWQQIRTFVLDRDGHTCRYCGGAADHVDHIVPRSKGGTNHPGNLCAACEACNLAKSDRDLAEFLDGLAGEQKVTGSSYSTQRVSRHIAAMQDSEYMNLLMAIAKRAWQEALDRGLEWYIPSREETVEWANEELGL